MTTRSVDTAAADSHRPTVAHAAPTPAPGPTPAPAPNPRSATAAAGPSGSPLRDGHLAAVRSRVKGAGGLAVSPAAAYERGLEHAHGAGREAPGYRLRCADGSLLEVPLERWVAPATAVDERLLARASAPVLDVGCGPGRHLHALRRRDLAALGVDVSPVAVRLARAGGAEVLRASVFDALPGTGCWSTALLLDGNIGIGGAPLSLLTRVRDLLRRGGVALVELEGPGSASRVLRLRLEGPGISSAWFRWSRTSVDAIPALARRAGFELGSCWHDEGRWFALLARRA